MTWEIILNWIFRRLFGLRDIPLLVKHFKNKKLKTTNGNRINVTMDHQEDRAIEAMEGHTESCPYWYSTRLFQGTECDPTQKANPEYWVGIRCTFLAPIIPIPICSDEKVFKIGTDNSIYWDSYHNYGRFYKLIDHYSDYNMHRIYNECTVNFLDSDVTYKNDEVWSSYD